MQVKVFRMRQVGVLARGDGIEVEGHGVGMIVEIVDGAAGRCLVLFESGEMLPLIMGNAGEEAEDLPETTHQTTTTLQ